MRGPEQRGVTETKVFLLDPKRIMVQSVFSYGEVDAFWGTLGGNSSEGVGNAGPS